MIQDSLPVLWSTWVERFPTYRTSIELYTSTELWDGQLLNFHLLSIMQCLETLHRERFGGAYLPEDAYLAIAAEMISHIPASVEHSHHQALKSRIKYGNEYSLRKRLVGLGSTLSATASEQIHPKLSELLLRAVDTRNYLTHHTAELEPSALKGANLYWGIRLLRWFFNAVLLTDMGLPKELLEVALSQSEDLIHAKKSLKL